MHDANRNLEHKDGVLTSSSFPEVWGGFECTVLRTRAGWRDQIRETGHYARPQDLDAAAGLGLRTIRYPVLFEHVSPNRPDECDWSWHDERLAYLQRLGIAPIAGLIHHGGGPKYTNLLDPAFPDLVAAHAERVARRYPWIQMWTPVNEPLTTARFSGLYGHWFPFGNDIETCLRIVANECRAVLLSMRAIRQVIPQARLMQTEDLGCTFSTSQLAYQAQHENERRWISLDLLTGRIDRTHGWWQAFLNAGVPEAHMLDFLEGDLAPMVIGLNYYITSERFLDHRVDHYAEHFRGGNGRDRYADIEAVRVSLSPDQKTGWKARLQEAWERYKPLPLAITEAHIGWCGPEEQVLWLCQAWDAVMELRRQGVDLQAVTIWALFGAVDWNSLLTRRDGHYEAGAFDACHPSGTPEPTLIAAAAEALAKHGSFTHPALPRTGWWQREDRYHAPILAEAAE